MTIARPDERDPMVWEPGGVARYVAALRDAAPGDEIVLRTPFGRGVLLRVLEIDNDTTREDQLALEEREAARLADLKRGGNVRAGVRAGLMRSGALTEGSAAEAKQRARTTGDEEF